MPGEEKKLSKKEEAFRARVDNAFQMTTIGLTVTVAATSATCPPACIVAGVAIPIVGGLYYYDTKNDYKLSHWIVDHTKKPFKKKKRLNHSFLFAEPSPFRYKSEDPFDALIKAIKQGN